MTSKIKVITDYDPSDFEASLNAFLRKYDDSVIVGTQVTEIAGSRPRYTAIIVYG